MEELEFSSYGINVSFSGSKGNIVINANLSGHIDEIVLGREEVSKLRDYLDFTLQYENKIK